ncbi:MAG: choline kinase [Proteobacteria bacterium]|nr:MAG: choline kinase [Pseudomonadota bacterium]
MHPALQRMVAEATHAEHVQPDEVIQSLWSGYGEIIRLQLSGCEPSSAILKHVKPPSVIHHPRGWHSDASHARKLKSYAVEMRWYEHWSQSCTAKCRVPKGYLTTTHNDEFIILLEDLDAAGFSIRKEDVEIEDIRQCLHWLAYFHATFLGKVPKGLWDCGSYWHLDTRADELAAMQHKPLQQAAVSIDLALKNAHYQTLIHGDAKLANFCFADDAQSVAAVDFQYVGGGCGMKDVAYFLGSCLDDAQCETSIPELLDVYFKYLKQAIKAHHPQIDYDALESEWRGLFPIAWVDFYRFLDGWMVDHWKINSYTRRLAAEVLKTSACTS